MVATIENKRPKYKHRFLPIFTPTSVKRRIKIAEYPKTPVIKPTSAPDAPNSHKLARLAITNENQQTKSN